MSDFLDLKKSILDSVVNIEKNDITRENANVNANTPAGMMMKFASESGKEYASKYLISPKFIEAMNEGYIYINDLDYYPTKSFTCVQYPLDKILSGGLVYNIGDIRPAKRIETATSLAAITFQINQNEMHGGQAIPAFDFFMAPYVRKTFLEEIDKLEVLSSASKKHWDDIRNSHITDYIEKDITTIKNPKAKHKQIAINNTIRRTKQAMESFVHNLCTMMSRGGGQTVFSSINYGTDTSAEGRCVIRELLNVTYEGIGKGTTAIFPIQIWKLKKGVSRNKTDKNYDLLQQAIKVSARRFFPNFLNLDSSFNKDDKWDSKDPLRYMHEVATMG